MQAFTVGWINLHIQIKSALFKNHKPKNRDMVANESRIDSKKKIALFTSAKAENNIILTFIFGNK